jgi:hypothetical protein
MAVTDHKVSLGNWGDTDRTVAEHATRADAFCVAAEQDESVARIGGNFNVRGTSHVFHVRQTSCLAGHTGGMRRRRRLDVNFFSGPAQTANVPNLFIVGIQWHNAQVSPHLIVNKVAHRLENSD